MTGDVWQTDKGDITNQTQLDVSRGHPLAAGLSGRVTVANAPSKFIWGKPAAAARKVGAIVNKSIRWGIFAYDTATTWWADRAGAPGGILPRARHAGSAHR
jgi:hypothetical protein